MQFDPQTDDRRPRIFVHRKLGCDLLAMKFRLIDLEVYGKVAGYYQFTRLSSILMRLFRTTGSLGLTSCWLIELF